MKNRIIMTFWMGLSVSCMYANDAYDIMNPHQSMNPWKVTKSELRMAKKRMDAHDRFLENQGEGYRTNDKYGKVTPAAAKQSRLHLNYINKYYFSEPYFPRIERARESLRSWFAPRYKKGYYEKP